jgi:site-specific DNA-methyltransferase (adenine-specific)
MSSCLAVNNIYNENCLDTMAKMPDNFVDLTVTSPPYDDLRTYNGYSFDFESIAKELYRVTKDGGTVVWVVGDATKEGSETLTSFRHALFFKDCGFNVETMIWNKNGFTAVGALKYRYGQVFEYMFILTKDKSKTFNPIKDRVNKQAGKIQAGTFRQTNGETKKKATNGYITPYYGIRFNVWDVMPENSSKNRFHPAQFPEQLANDHIISWSNENDIVYDPFMGSGTTAKMAIVNNRNYIGSEISAEYVEIIKKRISNCTAQHSLF